MKATENVIDERENPKRANTECSGARMHLRGLAKLLIYRCRNGCPKMLLTLK